jgi:hypothetical protein
MSVLKQDFSNLSDELTLELMRHDAEFCGVEKMNNWSNGGRCPYSDMERDFIFSEIKNLWVPGTPTLRGKDLWEALAKEKNIKLV